MRDAERLAFLFVGDERCGRHPPRDRQVRRRRAQVLAEGHNLDAHRTEIGESADDLGRGLAHAEDDP